jgi:hypothetical protein
MMMTDDEFLEKLVEGSYKAYGSEATIWGKPKKEDRRWLLLYKVQLLKAASPEDFYNICNEAAIKKNGLHLSGSYIQQRRFWDILYSEMFNHAGIGSHLDPNSDKIYRLKSSNRKFKVTDAGDGTVVIQFLDDKKKVDLSKNDFDNECELIDGEN